MTGEVPDDLPAAHREATEEVRGSRGSEGEIVRHEVGKERT
jgi:hypothetical protein